MKNKMWKRVAAGVMCSSMIFLTACGSNNQKSVDSGSKDGKDGKRTITWMTTRSSWKTMDEIAEDYMKQHPDVKIEFERISDRGSYNQKVQILATSKSMPDLIDGVPEQLRKEIAGAGALVDIDELYKELGYDKALPVGLEYARLSDGKLYEMAWENNVEYFWYNKSMFEKAGITKEPETFEEFLDVCKKLKDAGYTPISVFPGWNVSRFLAMIPFRMTGNDFLEGIISGNAKMTDEPGKEAAEFVATLGKEYFQPGWATSDYSNALETFLSGNAAMYLIGTWQFNSFLDEKGEVKPEYGHFNMPTLPDSVTAETDMISHAGTGTMVNAEKYDDTLKDFLKFVLAEYPDKAFWENNVLPAAEFDTGKGEISEFWKSVLDDSSHIEKFLKPWDVRLNAGPAEVMLKEQVNLGMGEITPEEFCNRLDEALKADKQ
ncbi:MAG: extracellular solute-binding protein [Lacrimispora sp.]|uniref:ABC transporter substrate-binding protein n=1 Tax=Lacrimispora sp. TaxID=2719234 RepID=UPI0039E528F1